MQIVFLPDAVTVALFIAMWLCFQVGFAYVCYKMPVASFEKDNLLYSCKKFERGGSFYETFCGIHKWKKFLPDGGALFKKGYSKKHMHDFSEAGLKLFIAESRRAELTHWLAITPFWVFGFFAAFPVVWIMLLYALAVNMPCILAQRYNRPRAERLLHLVEERGKGRNSA